MSFAPDVVPYFEVWTPQCFAGILEEKPCRALNAVKEMFEFFLFGNNVVAIVVFAEISGCHNFL